MEEFDFIIVGAGSSGCVLAGRLSEQPGTRVLLVEAGPEDSHPYVAIPKGIAKLRMHPTLSWRFPVEPTPERPDGELWPRGKMIGGTSSLNGMFYFRGQPQDYDKWEELGNPGWGWKDIGPCFKRMEDHALGESDIRGEGGPLHVSLPYKPNSLDEAMLKAGVELGLPRQEDMNGLDQLGVGLAPINTWRGRRWSAADAFLKPARRRKNLVVMTNVVVDRVLFENKRTVGIACRVHGKPTTFRTRGDVILSAGAIKSPHILQLSGIGPGEALKRAGVEVIADQPGVGANMREHFAMTIIHSLKNTYGENREYHGLRLAKNVLRYYLLRSGVLSESLGSVQGFAQTGLENRPDIKLSLSPLSWDTSSTKSVRVKTRKEPGLTCIGSFLHPESRGSITLRSSNPDDPPLIKPNWLTSEIDQRKAVSVFRIMRDLLAQPALRPYMGPELAPGPQIQSDEDMLKTYKRIGSSTNHAIGTCSMGSGPDAVLDNHLRVRGVSNLRVVDCSSIPVPMSGNTNAPAMVLGWRAADVIAAETR